MTAASLREHDDFSESRFGAARLSDSRELLVLASYFETAEGLERLTVSSPDASYAFVSYVVRSVSHKRR